MEPRLSPQIIIIAGPNGVGKSTLAPFLLRDKLNLTEYMNADTKMQVDCLILRTRVFGLNSVRQQNE
jgi:predicted ABC-type ATPase